MGRCMCCFCSTLGIVTATSLALRGWRVAVVERGPLRGRTQEWNISRKEINEMAEVRRACMLGAPHPLDSISMASSIAGSAAVVVRRDAPP
eukprot:355955-Chlamydomonas_euryale.AAC.7